MGARSEEPDKLDTGFRGTQDHNYIDNTHGKLIDAPNIIEHTVLDSGGSALRGPAALHRETKSS